MSVKFESPSMWTASNIAMITMRGNDRISFLHNFCTNDIKKLVDNSVIEAYVTNIQGKCLGYVTVFQASDELLLVTSNHKTEELVAHLDRYIITEDVEITLNLKPNGLLLTGNGIEKWLQQEQLTGTLITNHWFNQSSYWFFGELSATQQNALNTLSDDQVHAARIRTGIPIYGDDVTDENLAQEVNRDQQTISFTKGCYLGQEPIARIDALGNVHWYLVRVDLGVIEAQSGDILTRESKPIAKIRSKSSLTNEALAYVKRGSHESGSNISADQGEFKVI